MNTILKVFDFTPTNVGTSLISHLCSFFFFCFNLRVQVVVSFLSVTEAEVEKPQRWCEMKPSSVQVSSHHRPRPLWKWQKILSLLEITFHFSSKLPQTSQSLFLFRVPEDDVKAPPKMLKKPGLYLENVSETEFDFTAERKIIILYKILI